MDAAKLVDRYRELQAYVGWSDDDARRLRAAAPRLEPFLPALIDDFYDRIERHPGARRVLTGGAEQVDRLKGTLLRWLRELLSGADDADYVRRRWRVGGRHVEIGLDPAYAHAAMSRLRAGLGRALDQCWGDGDPQALHAAQHALDRRIDLDLVLIEEAYQAEFTRRMQRTERLATLGRFAGGVVHELRNPLNVVRTSAYCLRHVSDPTPERRDEHLRRIERQVELAEGVISALANVARMPAPALAATPIEPCLRDALEVNPPGPSIAVALEVPPDLPPALADADQLRIVFGNLIRNAREAMPTGGRLAITGANGDGGALEVRVADTGSGIAAELLPHIVEPLFSTRARGLGLGLAIVRAILDQCGGELRIESEPDHGSAFTVRLPSAPVLPEAPTADEP